MKFILFSALIYVMALSCLYSQAQRGDVSTPPTFRKAIGELDEVIFEGNETISDDELMAIITSKPTSKSLPHKAINYYAYLAYMNPATPRHIKAMFTNVLKQLAYEIKYFNETRAKADTARIKEYYNQYGFHKANATFRFKHDLKNRKNTLTFYITENARWEIDTVRLLGLENVAPEVMEEISKVNALKPGNPYKQLDLMQDVSRINKILLDKGYFYSKFDTPKVTLDTVEIKDSITVRFHPGKRQRIAAINFIDSLRGQNAISHNMKMRQLDFKIGDWYGLTDVQNSENNLRSLGTFDIVKIDTSRMFHPITDTSLSFIGFLQYRKQKEWAIAPYFNKDQNTGSFNVGADASFTHRNIFGAAQVFNPFVRFTLLDLSRWADKNSTTGEYEILAGLNLAQPLLWTIGATRWGLTLQPSYSYRTISDVFQVRTIQVPIKFPIRFPTFTLVNQADLSLTLERQELANNYEDVRTEALKSNDPNNPLTHLDSLQIIQALKTYENIYYWVKEKKGPLKGILTSIILGGNIYSDMRDNPLSPLRGHYFTVGLEFAPKGLAAAQYLKLQGSLLKFWALSPQLVLGWKIIKAGYIHWWNPHETYVPFERQFFAGGSNSVRGWASRQLRYINDSLYKSENLNFYKDFVGSGIQIEGSFEFRFRLAAPSTNASGLASTLSNFGIVPFLDYGNTFQWFLVDSTNNYNYVEPASFGDVINPKNWGWAVGIGVRYETPVGPFRVDFGWPLWDPSDTATPWLWEKNRPFNQMKFHIGLGHAF